MAAQICIYWPIYFVKMASEC